MKHLEIEVEIMRATGLDDEQIARLALLKQRVGCGKVDDLTMEHKKLVFQRYLAKQGYFRKDGVFPKEGVIFNNASAPSGSVAIAKPG